MHPTNLLTRLLACICLVSAPLRADLLHYEPFDYPAGEDALDGNGGFVARVAGAVADIVTGSLPYTDTLGNRLVTRGGHVLLDSDEEGAQVDERAPVNLAAANGATIWVSVIGRQTAGTNARFLNVGFYAPDNTVLPADSGTSADEVFTLGMGSNLLPEQRWRLQSRATGTSTGFVSAASPVPTTQQTFLLARIALNAEGTLERYTFWVNPLLDRQPPEDAGLTFLSTNSDIDSWADIITLRFAAGEAQGANPASAAVFDELRVGDSWADVMPSLPPLALTHFSRDPVTGVVSLRWFVEPEVQDVVEWSPDLASWLPYPESLRTGGLTRTEASFSVAPAAGPRYFLRVRSSQP